MFEQRRQRVASKKIFIFRLLKSIGVALLVVFSALMIGIFGYHYLEEMSWIDSFLNAAMILSAMGPVTPLTTTGGKLFAGFYALFSGIIFISLVAIIMTPVVHRILHTFHSDD